MIWPCCSHQTLLGYTLHHHQAYSCTSCPCFLLCVCVHKHFVKAPCSQSRPLRKTRIMLVTLAERIQYRDLLTWVLVTWNSKAWLKKKHWVNTIAWAGLGAGGVDKREREARASRSWQVREGTCEAGARSSEIRHHPTRASSSEARLRSVREGCQSSSDAS